MTNAKKTKKSLDDPRFSTLVQELDRLYGHTYEDPKESLYNLLFPATTEEDKE